MSWHIFSFVLRFYRIDIPFTGHSIANDKTIQFDALFYSYSLWLTACLPICQVCPSDPPVYFSYYTRIHTCTWYIRICCKKCKNVWLIDTLSWGLCAQRSCAQRSQRTSSKRTYDSRRSTRKLSPALSRTSPKRSHYSPPLPPLPPPPPPPPHQRAATSRWPPHPLPTPTSRSNRRISYRFTRTFVTCNLFCCNNTRMLLIGPLPRHSATYFSPLCYLLFSLICNIRLKYCKVRVYC